MGRGTNLLVRDGGVRGLVVNLGDLNRIEGGGTAPGPRRGACRSLGARGDAPFADHQFRGAIGGSPVSSGPPGFPGPSEGDRDERRCAWSQHRREGPLGGSRGRRGERGARAGRRDLVLLTAARAFRGRAFVLAAGLELFVSTEQAVLAETKRCLEEHKRRLPFRLGERRLRVSRTPGRLRGAADRGRPDSRGSGSAAPRSRRSTRTSS